MTLVFDVDVFYSNENIRESLGVGNAGGVRICLESPSVVRRMAVLTSLPTARQANENPYHDRIEGDILVYTGAGREGDQLLSGINRRIPQQQTAPFPIYGFRIEKSRRDAEQGPRRWRFLGLLEYLRHYQDVQIDARGQLRKAWMFEFRIHRGTQGVEVESDSSIAVGLYGGGQGNTITGEDDRVVDVIGGAQDGDPVRSFQGLEEIRSRLLTLDPQNFELLVRDVLERSGFENVTVTRYSQDGGIDVNAYSSSHLWPIGGMLIQVQAKRWLHTVGRKEVAELRGSLEPFARGVVVTTSHFSRAATNEARSTGKNPIVLIDGMRFSSIINSFDDFTLPR